MVGNKVVKEDKGKVIIFAAGTPPIGSWHQRILMFERGFAYHGINTIHIVPYPAPTYATVKQSPSHIKFCYSPITKKPKRNLWAILYKLIGTIRGIKMLKKIDNIKFIIVPGLDFMQGILLMRYCRKYKIHFIAEIADENGKLFSEEKLSFVERLAKYNQIFYEKKILKNANNIFVFTNYLEKKYKNIFPNRVILRTVPSIIDYDYFKKLSLNNILDINQEGIEKLLAQDYPKIVYAGACNRTNGLFFFLDAAAKLKKQGVKKFMIFFFFVYGNVNSVSEYCKKIGLEENVFIFKPVLAKYIPAIYENADILLLPEHGDIIANAGFPGKVSELLASGKAILSTNFSDLSEYLVNEKNSMVAEIGDSLTYTDNLKRLLVDADLRKKLGLNAIETAKKFFDCKSAVNVYLENEK